MWRNGTPGLLGFSFPGNEVKKKERERGGRERGGERQRREKGRGAA